MPKQCIDRSSQSRHVELSLSDVQFGAVDKPSALAHGQLGARQIEPEKSLDRRALSHDRLCGSHFDRLRQNRDPA